VRHLLLGLFHATEAWRIPDAEVDRLGRDFPDLDIARAGSREELEGALPGAEILFAWAPGESALARAGPLRWIHAPAAGVGAFITPSVLRRGILLTNSRGVHAVPIAEHTLGMLVALARHFRPAVADQITTGLDRERWWVGSGRPLELRGRTLGLFGYGAIGREIARRALAFGMRVIAVRRHPGSGVAWDPDLLKAARVALRDASGTTARLARNRITAGRAQLRLGRDLLWYPYSRSDDDWEPAGPPQSDPARAAESL